MTIRIDQKIVDAAVVRPASPWQPVQMDERLKRPEVLSGRTYKIKTPLSEHALYVTINDVILNEGTEHEQRRPFEIFINSKNMDHFQWIVALTRIVSAVFRKGGDCTFLAEELRSVFDPKGGYFKPGGRFMPSLVAEIGDVIEIHLRSIGLLVRPPPASVSPEALEGVAEADAAAALPCGKCHSRSVIRMDGCMTCLSCGDSKCG